MRLIPFNELPTLTGQALGTSDWFAIDQDRINRFAEVTLDQQWIHVDAARAAQGPFGTTVAHGYLTLSLLPMFLQNTWGLQGARMGVNYGLNRVRFPAPVPVGSRLRAHFKLLQCEAIEGGWQVVSEVSIEREGSPKPVCVAESVSRHYR
jgi:hypothetical protein